MIKGIYGDRHKLYRRHIPSKPRLALARIMERFAGIDVLTHIVNQESS